MHICIHTPCITSFILPTFSLSQASLSYTDCLISFSPDAADGYKAFFWSVCDVVCGRGFIFADHHSGTHCVQAGDPKSQGATLQILATHKPGMDQTHTQTHNRGDRDCGHTII